MVWSLMLCFLLAFPSMVYAEPVEGVADETPQVVDVGDGDTIDAENSVPSDPSLAPVMQDRVGGPYASISDSSYAATLLDIAQELPYGVDWVVWRSGQYVYSLYYGPLTLEGSLLSGQGGTVVRLMVDSSYTGTTHLTSTAGGLSLDVGDSVVYCSIGRFPRRSTAARQVTYAFAVLTLMVLVRSIFSFVLRMGVRVHEQA